MDELKKIALPTILVFAVITIFNIVFHGVFMEKIYNANSYFFRPHDVIAKHRYYMWLANFIYSFAFCYMYSKGHDKKANNIAQGFRYGIWISLLIWLPDAIINYTIYPFPKTLVLKWLAGYTLQSLLAGMTASTTYNKV